MAYTYFSDLDELVGDIPPDSIISRTFYRGEKTRAILFGFAAGQELSEHTAAFPAILHFLRGEAQLTLGDETQEVKQGAWVQMPAHLPHSVEAKTNLIMLLYLLE